MSLPLQSFTAIGAITAAIIAGGISFISTVLAKDQKISEFRQAWIDALRDDIAEELSLFITIFSIVIAMTEDGKTRDDITAYIFAKEDNFRKLEMVHARIMLRLNPKEHTNLHSALKAIENHAKDSNSTSDRNMRDALAEQLTKESQIVLKNEWIRVKRGELMFFATKWISLVIFVASLIAATLYMLGHLNIQLT